MRSGLNDGRSTTGIVHVSIPPKIVSVEDGDYHNYSALIHVQEIFDIPNI